MLLSGQLEFFPSKIYLWKTTPVCEQPNKQFLPRWSGALWIYLRKFLGSALIYFLARVPIRGHAGEYGSGTDNLVEIHACNWENKER